MYVGSSKSQTPENAVEFWKTVKYVFNQFKANLIRLKYSGAGGYRRKLGGLTLKFQMRKGG